MKFIVALHCLNEAGMIADPASLLITGRAHTLHPASHYDRRSDLVVEAAGPHAALQWAWCVFENGGANVQTPDGGRSTMMGDLARVETETGAVSWWICATLGWVETREPGTESVRINEQGERE